MVNQDKHELLCVCLSENEMNTANANYYKEMCNIVCVTQELLVLVVLWRIVIQTAGKRHEIEQFVIFASYIKFLPDVGIN